MYRILKKEKLSKEVFRFTIEAPMIARERKAGQFVIVQKGGDFEERIPLTIADADSEKGTITIVFQAIGEGTHRLAMMNEGDAIENVLGPLGRPTHIEKFGRCVCVGGGIGVAPLYPIAKALKEAGANHIFLYVSHCENTVLDGEMIKSGLIDKVFTTNSILTKEDERIEVFNLWT